MPNIRRFTRTLINFVANIWRFKKVLWQYKIYDHVGLLLLFRQSLIDLYKSKLVDMEEDVSKNKKLEKINRAIQILTNIVEDKYYQLAIDQLGYTPPEIKYKSEKIDANRSILTFENSDEETKIILEIMELEYQISVREWNELWDILKGQEDATYVNSEEYMEKFDGSGLGSWWS
jgi:hypothetical protein